MTFIDTNLTTQQLRVVVTIAKLGSFVAAAQDLGMSQSALSRTVQGIEEALGVPLFSRSTRRVELTAAGCEFASMADRVLEDLALTAANMRGIATLKRGLVIVSTLQSIAQGMLADTVVQFAQRFPGIRLHIREGVESAVEADIRSGVADFGICALDSLDETFTLEKLGVERLHLVTPTQLAVTKQSRVSLKSLADQPMISLPEGSKTRAIVDAAAGSAGISLNHAIIAENFATVLALVERGAGVAIVPSGVLRAAKSARMHSHPLADSSMCRTITLARLATRTLSPAAAQFVQILKQHSRVD